MNYSEIKGSDNQADSLFEMFAAICRPVPTGAIPKSRIIHLDHTITIDKIIIILSITDYSHGNVETGTEVIIISHDSFRDWCQKTDRLDLNIDEFAPYYIGFADYLLYHVTNNDFKEYITEHKLSPPYEWSI